MAEKIINKVQFKPNLTNEIEVFRVEEVVARHYLQLIRPHRTNFYHIFIFEKGGLTHAVDFHQVKIKKAQALFINKDCVHHFDKNRKYNGFLIVFTDRFFCTSENHQKFLHNVTLFNNGQLFSLIDIQNELAYFQSVAKDLIAACNRKPYPFQEDFLHNMLHNLLIAANTISRNQAPLSRKASIEYEMATLFKGMVEEHYATEKSVTFYSERLLCSEKKLQAATRKIYGKSPKQIIDNRVLLEAKRLLSYSSLSVKQIGAELGFDDPAYFFRFFKKNAHVTPLDFREKYLTSRKS